ncbi:MAG: T9SS type A sorting domain-containing protein [Chitinophagaceae bacterium]|nr:T9SS type A sorting domain-containing protein [Chitinophagaceae bacterium]
MSTRDLGVYFSDTAIIRLPYTVTLPFSPQISNSGGYLSDTGNWIPVRGSYVARGGEQYIVIGNFVDDYSIDTARVKDLPSPGSRSYIYIDDVSLSASLDIQEHFSEGVSVFPHPAQDEVYIKMRTASRPLEIKIYDISSRMLLSKTFTKEITLDVATWAKGCYYFQIMNGNTISQRGKILKQ